MPRRDTRPQEATGVSFVSQIAETIWNSGFAETTARNDDGIDATITLRKHGEDTGAMLLVQIKCGSGYRSDTKKRPNVIGLTVQALEMHRKRWSLTPLPTILVYVDPQNLDKNNRPKAWWADLKSEHTYAKDRKNLLLIDKKKRFGEHSKGDLYRLCGYRVNDQSLPHLSIGHQQSMYYPLTGPIKPYARQVYQDWADAPPNLRNNPILGEVIVNRVGWRHMCRKSRKPAHIAQSWQLVGAAREIVRSVDDFTQVGKTEVIRNGDFHAVQDHVSLRAIVTFPHRHESVVQVVIRRRREFAESSTLLGKKNWFLSVYERRRGK